jgi:carboxylesterase type B
MNAMERCKEATQELDTKIEKVKKLFEERIQEVQDNRLNEARIQGPALKVVEILGKGQERICKEIQENNMEIRMMQERVLHNIELFRKMSTQEIKEMIINSGNRDEFNEFAQRLIAMQENMKEFRRMEDQHETIFRKEDENAQDMTRIRGDTTEERKA